MTFWFVYLKDLDPESADFGSIVKMSVEGPVDKVEMEQKVRNVAKKDNYRFLRMVLCDDPTINESKVLEHRR